MALDAVDKGVEMAGIPGLSLLVKGALHVRDQVRRRDIRNRLENLGLWPSDNEGRVAQNDIAQADIEKLLPQALYHDVCTWLRGSPSRQLRLLIDGNFEANTPATLPLEGGIREITIKQADKTLWSNRTKVTRDLVIATDLTASILPPR